MHRWPRRRGKDGKAQRSFAFAEPFVRRSPFAHRHPRLRPALLVRRLLLLRARRHLRDQLRGDLHALIPRDFSPVAGSARDARRASDGRDLTSNGITRLSDLRARAAVRDSAGAARIWAGGGVEVCGARKELGRACPDGEGDGDRRASGRASTPGRPGGDAAQAAERLRARLRWADDLCAGGRAATGRVPCAASASGAARVHRWVSLA
jgi:hypothetical protein